MLAFVTSLRAKALAKDWDHIVWLLERCLGAMVNQTSPEWRAYVVCHDVPETANASDPRIRWLTADIPLPERTNADMVRDKVIKTSIAVEAALAEGASYVMPVDADDLVSRRLCEHAGMHSGETGWIIKDGVSHYYGSLLMEPISGFHHRCGTCNLVASGLISFANDPEYRNARVASIIAMGHAAVEVHYAKARTPLLSLPFPGAVYIQHGDNTSNVDFSGPGSHLAGMKLRLGRFKQYTRRLRSSRMLTTSSRAEFYLPSPHEVPAQWRASWWQV
jgi:hypothetical protein